MQRKPPDALRVAADISRGTDTWILAGSICLICGIYRVAIGIVDLSIR